MALNQWPRGYRFGSIAAVPMWAISISIGLLPAISLHFALAPHLPDSGPWAAVLMALLVAGEIVLTALFLALLCIVLRRLLRLGTLTAPIDSFGRDFSLFTAYYLIYSLVWRAVLPFILNTWLLVMFFRAMGARVGKDCFINTPNLFECPMISIGDGVVIGAYAVLNPHSYEHGRIVFGPITIGDDVEIGAGAIILPHVTIEPGVIVAANSLVPKGKTLRAGCLYAGVPARLVPRGAPLAGDTPAVTSSASAPTESTFPGDAPAPLTSEQLKTVLMEAYKIQNMEAADLGKFMVRLSIAVLGITFTGIYYSITTGMQAIIAGIPPLAGLTLAMMLSISTMMLKNAFKMCEIEEYLKARGAIGLDWELRFGGLGRSRMFDLDNILITAMFVTMFVIGSMLTATGQLIDPAKLVGDYRLYRAVFALDLFMAAWIALSLVYYSARRAMFKKMLSTIGPRNIVPGA